MTRKGGKASLPAQWTSRRSADTANRDEYFKAYGEYSRVLRTWFVAYGIGAPALLLTNEFVTKAIKASGEAGALALFFLIGVFLQVVLAIVNKASMWGIYYGEISPTFKHTKRFKIALWISDCFWMDLLIDFLTIAFFAIATWRWYMVLVA